MADLTDDQILLFTEPNFGYLATVMPDGSPQVTALWIDHRDGLIWVNTQSGRTKPTNIERDPRVAIAVTDRNDPYTAVHVRGRVVEMTNEGANDHIRWLAKKYRGDDRFDFKPGTRRIIVKIQPESVSD